MLYVRDIPVDLNNIVFLDIDGVMNHFKSGVDFLKESIDVLNYLYENYDIKIVLSSSWRESYPLYYLQYMFKDYGIKAPLIDKTNVYFENNIHRVSFSLDQIDDLECNEHYCRDFEIKEWVNRYGIKHYVIIDDFPINDIELKKHSILTLNYGDNENDLALRNSHLEEIIKKLQI